MKEQVTSIEQSKRLIELGVPAEKASMVWFPEYKIGDNKLRIYPAGTYELIMKYKSLNDMEYKVIPAFTVADLIAILPTPTTCGGFQIGLDRVRNDSTHIFYEDCADSSHIIFFIENSLVESCVKAIEWVISNNYKLNI